jgi:hypothetical protein
VRIDAMRPNSLTNPTTATVVAREDETGVSANWTVTAQATCADPIPGLRVFASTVTVPVGSVGGSVLADCPQDGSQVLGTGAEVQSGSGQVGLTGVFPPTPFLFQVFAFADEDETGYDQSWQLTAYAFCAKAPVFFNFKSVGPATAVSQSAVAQCAFGKVIGAGVDLPDSGRQVIIGAFGVINSLRTGALSFADVDETGFGFPWQLTSYAICAT